LSWSLRRLAWALMFPTSLSGAQRLVKCLHISIWGQYVLREKTLTIISTSPARAALDQTGSLWISRGATVAWKNLKELYNDIIFITWILYSIDKLLVKILSQNNVVAYYLYYWFRFGGEATHSTYNMWLTKIPYGKHKYGKRSVRRNPRVACWVRRLPVDPSIRCREILPWTPPPTPQPAPPLRCPCERPANGATPPRRPAPTPATKGGRLGRHGRQTVPPLCCPCAPLCAPRPRSEAITPPLLLPRRLRVGQRRRERWSWGRWRRGCCCRAQWIRRWPPSSAEPLAPTSSSSTQLHLHRTRIIFLLLWTNVS
jgi:hypothetical protein